MDARDHTPNTISEIIYVELINPNKKVIAKRTLKTLKGSAAGDFWIFTLHHGRYPSMELQPRIVN